MSELVNVYRIYDNEILHLIRKDEKYIQRMKEPRKVPVKEGKIYIIVSLVVYFFIIPCETIKSRMGKLVI